MRKLAHQMCAIFAGKMPHPASLIPGGVTAKPASQKIAAFGAMLQKLQMFIDHVYIPDVLEVAKAFKDYFKIGKGYDNFLSYGVFPESGNAGNPYLPAGVILAGTPGGFDSAVITEDVGHSRYSSVSGAHPSRGETIADPRKIRGLFLAEGPAIPAAADGSGPAGADAGRLSPGAQPGQRTGG